MYIIYISTYIQCACVSINICLIISSSLLFFLNMTGNITQMLSIIVNHPSDINSHAILPCSLPSPCVALE